jgi:hypothetical protein
MRLSFLAAASAAFLVGCATPQYNHVADVEQFSHPPVGATVTARVGDEMLSQGNIQYQDGIIVPAETTVGGYTFHGGFYVQTGQDEEYSYHSFTYGNSSGQPIPGLSAYLSKNFIVDPPSGIRARISENRLCVITIFNLNTCRDRDFERAQRMVAGENSFQQTLIYSGRVGDRINIAYRESSGNLARPAYSNDVEYDLSESTTIGYRGAVIRIIEATNTSITYEVVSNFNTPR